MTRERSIPAYACHTKVGAPCGASRSVDGVTSFVGMPGNGVLLGNVRGRLNGVGVVARLARWIFCAAIISFLSMAPACTPPGVDDGDGTGQEVPVDSDGDGVEDDADDCPNTSENVAVGNDGCPVVSPSGDSDNDGVNDINDQCAETAAGAVVDSFGCAAAQRDGDGDGVRDDRDECPGTGTGTAVSANGCAIVTTPTDSDGDGVLDVDDDCPGTQPGLVANAAGCASNQRDADGDGITDNRDQCSSTPPESAVDVRGCAASQRDSDGDGVTDNMDDCGGTVTAVTVDMHGCSDAQRDSDGDGVNDDSDACPATSTGLLVTSNGCPVPPFSGGSTGVGGGPGGTGTECTAPVDCDDDNACTTETCSNGFCGHNTIADCVSCNVLPVCPIVEAVFIMDTSGSMTDEAVALCVGIGQLVTALDAVGVTLQPHFYGITQNPGGPFSCLTGDVVAAFGGTVPGDVNACSFPGTFSAFESWGPAAAIVAQDFPWTAGTRRVIIPMSDEGPCNGNLPEGCNDPGDDRNSILNAITVANLNSAIISPVTGTGSSDCVKTLAAAAAAGTGGTVFNSTDPVADLAEALYAILLTTCDPGPCDDDNACTQDDVCVMGVCSGVAPSGCVPCANDLDCHDDNACTDDVCVAGICENSGNFDELTECCAPSDGTRTIIDDGELCTEDVCNPLTGVVTHPPVDVPTSCDDGHFCTKNDACVAGACEGTAIVGCRECTTNAGCDDNNVCTTDLCENDLCRYRNNYHANVSCCNPISGHITPIADSDVCTMDACNPATGVVSHDPISGPLCDDSLGCTINDQCVAGTCMGTSIGNVTCTQNADCPNNDCDLETGHCDCVNQTPLCLDPAPKVCSVNGAGCLTDADCAGNGVCLCDDPSDLDCVDDGQTIIVRVETEAGTEVVSGAQFYLNYDNDCLDFQGIGPCAGEELFTFVLSASVNESTGTVFYAVSTDPQTREVEGTSQAHALACIKFARFGSCMPAQPCILEDVNPFQTILADPFGNRIPLDLCPCNPAAPMLSP